LLVVQRIVGAALATSKWNHHRHASQERKPTNHPPCRLTFTTTSIAGKSMIVQTTNTGGDLGSNQFDLAIPGGGVGLFNACTDEWNAPSSGWGAQYGGISSNTCSTFPKALQAGCGFRFDWFEGADNPEVEFERVECPAEIVAKSGCKRDDDGAQVKVAGAVVASSSSAAAQEATVASSSVEAASSASSTSESASIATSSEAIASSAEAYTAPAVESSAATYTTPTPESSAAYTSAPAMASSPSSSAAGIEVSSTPLSSTTTPSSPASSEDAACNVQYVYEYDL
jgi:hypothetical protein